MNKDAIIKYLKRDIGIELYLFGALGKQKLIVGNKCGDSKRCRIAFENNNYEACARYLKAFNEKWETSDEFNKISFITKQIIKYWINEHNIDISSIVYGANIQLKNYMPKYKLHKGYLNSLTKYEDDNYEIIILLIDFIETNNIKFGIPKINIDITSLEKIINYLKDFISKDFNNFRFYYNIKELSI